MLPSDEELREALRKFYVNPQPSVLADDAWAMQLARAVRDLTVAKLAEAGGVDVEGLATQAAKPFWAQARQQADDQITSALETEIATAIRTALAQAEARRGQDSARLDWLEEQANGIGVVHDDEDAWIVANTGMQAIRSTQEPSDPWDTSYIVMPEEFGDFKPTIREAIDAARTKEPA